jgi:DNA recombination protein RmuC
MTVISLLTLVIGLLLGAALGFYVARSREAGMRTDLAARTSAAEERARAAEQRTALVDGQLAERFQALSAQALDASTRRFLEMAEGRLSAANVRAAGELEARKAAVEGLVEPLKQTLTRVEAQLRDSDAARERSHAALTEQVTIARRSSEELRIQTQALVTALRRPEARGRWGEMQLRRVVELAGMSAHCDFDEQVSLTTSDGGQRPDMVIHLAGGKHIVVDSKVSLAAYLEAAEAAGDDVRDARLRAHARHLRDHVDKLAAKAYWAAISPAPEFVVLFIPGEAFLAPALDHDPGLLEYAMTRRVHIATPTTLVSLLRTAQYAWQQAALSDNARAVFDAGRELYERISGLGERVDQLGKALTGAVTAYNKTVGSLETRVLVSARRLQQLGIVDTDQETPRLVEQTSRTLSAPELTAVTATELPSPTPEPAPVAPELTEAEPGPRGTPELTAGAPESRDAEAASATPELFAAGPGHPAASTAGLFETESGLFEAEPGGPAEPPGPSTSVPEQPVAATERITTEPGRQAAPAAALTEEPADRTSAVPEPSPGPSADRGTEPPELVMTHINGAAR